MLSMVLTENLSNAYVMYRMVKYRIWFNEGRTNEHEPLAVAGFQRLQLEKEGFLSLESEHANLSQICSMIVASIGTDPA